MAEALNVTLREKLGSRNSRRLRRSGGLPAVLYGHGEENVSLALSEDEVVSAIRHGAHLVELTGAVNETALIKHVQWDTFGIYVVHVDLTRVSATERVEIELAVELKGDAPGTREGGVLEQALHTLTIECPAGAIPEHLVVNINQLKLNDAITAGQVALPEGAVLVGDPEEVVVHVVPAAPEAEEDAVPGEAAEPEVIRREREEEEEEG